MGVNLKKIKVIMRKKDIRNKELADEIGMIYSTFMCKMSNSRKFAVDELQKIAETLKVDINIFLD